MTKPKAPTKPRAPGKPKAPAPARAEARDQKKAQKKLAKETKPAVVYALALKFEPSPTKTTVTVTAIRKWGEGEDECSDSRRHERSFDLSGDAIAFAGTEMARLAEKVRASVPTPLFDQAGEVEAS